MKIPKFKNESEEADWWYNNRHKIKWGKPIVDASGKPMTPAEIVAAHIAKQKETQPITIRLSVADIERAKTQAERKGLGYQTYLKSLIHQALMAK
jgi:hypothetical protein